MRYMLIAAAVATAALASACATIQHYETAKQPIAQDLAAGVGDVILHIQRERDLANPAGKADLWGRRTHEGYTEVRYAGREPDGTLVFTRKDLAIHSNETTVTRMGFVPMPTSSTTNVTGRVGTTNVSGTGVTTGTAYLPAPQAQTIAIPSDAIAIRLAPGQGKNIRVGGYQIEVQQADGVGLQYRIIKM